MRSTVEGVDHVRVEDWCLGTPGHGWAGVGWGLWRGDAYDGISWDAYVDHMTAKGEGIDPSVARLHELPTGSLVWTRRRDSSYWLGRLTGAWQYRDGDEAQKLDMFNVRRCEWRSVGTQDSVPGKVVNNFSARRTLNPVTDPAAVRYTRRLWAQLAHVAGKVERIDPRDVVESLLGATDLEDLVAVYLQDQHDLVLVSRGYSTVGYECVLRNRRTGRRSVATVKSGGTPVDFDALPADRDVDVWAYAVAEGSASGRPRDDVRWIATNDLVRFITDRRAILPDQVARWLA